jgi:diaminopimelate decarboxylase
VGGVRLCTLAARYGTPAFILDEADVRCRCRSYTAALPGTKVAPAGKAFLCRAMARWIAEEGLSPDVNSAGEVAVAQAAGRIILYGNAKTPADLKAAFTYGAGHIVIDSLPEIARIAALAPRPQRVGFSLSSGAAADTEFDLAGFASRMCRAIASECIRLRVPVPCLVIEPGRPRRGTRHRRYNHSMASNYNLVGLPR